MSTLERHGRLDFLLNNAGGQYFVPAEGITAKGWRAVQRLNVAGTLTMCQAAYELAMRASGGTIVNVTVSPHQGFPAMAHTGAARAAVEALTTELADQWGADGVTVAAIALGRLATESLKKYPAELWQRAGRGRRRSSAWARWRSTPGWSHCWPRRWGGRSRARWSPSTARWTTGTGRGRREDLVRDGDVPTEERRTAPSPPPVGESHSTNV